MSINNDQFAAANKATVDALLAAVSTALASAERIARLNIETARSALDDASANAHALLNAKDPQQFAAIQSALVQPTIEKAVEYSRSIMEISHATHQELSGMFESQLAEFQKSATRLLQQGGGQVPVGSDGAFATLQAAIASAKEAYNAIASATLQAAAPETGKSAPATAKASRAGSRKTASK